MKRSFHLGYLPKNILVSLQSCEEAIMKLKSAGSTPSMPVYYVVNQILYPLVQGCESKDLKIIKVNHVNCCGGRDYNVYVYLLVLLGHDATTDNATSGRSEGSSIHYRYFVDADGAWY